MILGTDSTVVCPHCLSAYVTATWTKDYIGWEGPYEYSFECVCPNGCEFTSSEEDTIEEYAATSRYPREDEKDDFKEWVISETS